MTFSLESIEKFIQIVRLIIKKTPAVQSGVL